MMNGNYLRMSGFGANQAGTHTKYIKSYLYDL